MAGAGSPAPKEVSVDTDGQGLFNLMKEMTQDLKKVWEATMGQEKYTAADEPEYTKVTAREYEAGETLDHLRDALKNICDAWWSLNEAMKKSVYFEEDEDDVNQMKVVLVNLEQQLTRILESRGGV